MLFTMFAVIFRTLVAYTDIELDGNQWRSFEELPSDNEFAIHLNQAILNLSKS